jgi:hypothetical protein
MLQPHSLLWHYLWIGPDILLALLALAMLRRGLHRQFPAFFGYAVFESVGGAIIYVVDVTPSVFSDRTYWWSYLVFLVIEVVVKLVVVGEVFTRLLRRYPALGRFGKTLISGLGILLVFAATIIAAYANPTAFWLISATRILGRSTSLVQCGLVLFLIVFAAHFHLRWEHPVFGILLGFAISASVYVAFWALVTNWSLGSKSYLMDFLIMATFHGCVLIWCYYLLVPQKVPTTSSVSLPENNLATWNRELERLLGQ